MKLSKRPDPDGTVTLLDEHGTVVARGLQDQVADAQIAAEAALDEDSARTVKSVSSEEKEGGPGAVRDPEGKGRREGVQHRDRSRRQHPPADA